ncbi:MAG: AAA family ATPase, partial [Tepidiformaceae bacterium]
MIPRRLRLRNFLSYRDCTVDLTGLHVAVLTGRNGDGKSALLDAMTWALWGQGRGKSEEDRIHLGQPEMQVEFEFEVDTDRFVVIRKRTRGKSSGALNAFHLLPGGERVTIDGGTMRETQQEINRRLRMDYDTFVNSAFIAQGRSNEFTRKAPAERKEVFGKILGLEFYEKLADAAVGRRKDSQLFLRQSESATTEAQGEVERIPEVEARLKAVREANERLGPVIKELESQAAELRGADAAYRKLESDLQAAIERHRRSCERVDAFVARIAKAKGTLRATESIVERGRTIREAFAELGRLRAEESALSEAQSVAHRLERERDEALGAVEREQARLESQLDQATRELAEGATRAATLAEAEAGIAGLSVERTAIEAMRTKAREAAAAEGELRSSAAGLRAEARQVEAQARELKAKESQLDGAAMCPICRKPLGPGEADHVKAEYQGQRKAFGARFKACNTRADEEESQADALKQMAAQVEAEVGTREKRLQAQERDLHGAKMAAEEAAARLPAVEARVNDLTAVLAAGSFAAEARAMASEAAAKLAHCAYDAAKHGEVRRCVRELAPAADEYQALAKAETEASMLSEQIRQALEQKADAEREAEAAEVEVAKQRTELEQAEDIRPRLEGIERDRATVRDQSAAAARAEGSAEQELAQLKGLEVRLAEAVERERGLKDEVATYDDLAKAFGRNGVQAMLIEQSLPRVEQLANEMLVRMTGGRIQVQLAT